MAYNDISYLILLNILLCFGYAEFHWVLQLANPARVPAFEASKLHLITSFQSKEGIQPNMGDCIAQQQDPILRDKPLPLPNNVVEAPSEYIESLPAKSVRNKLVDALNIWFRIPEQPLSIIKRVIDQLHQSSLMLDDVQDGSALRRGFPSTHTIFGTAQTINTAGYKILEALQDVLKLENSSLIHTVLEELKALYIGQGFDLHWTCNLICPTEEELLSVLDHKTGGLFRLILKLMEAMSVSDRKPNLHFLVTLLGRHFAIRDDYQNLRSDKYSKTKGFCEDLDEGKYSLQLLYTFRMLPENQSLTLRNMLSQRRVNGKSSPEHKELILRFMEQCGSFDYVLATLKTLQIELYKEIKTIEEATKTENKSLRVLIDQLFL